MTSPIRLAQSVISEREMEAVRRIMEVGYLGMGPEVGRFEDELSDFVGGGRKVVCVNTGTSALHLAVQACGIGPGDEVLVPTLTYVASFQAISATGAKPIAVDVVPSHGGIDPEDASKRVSERTRAIMPVHYGSNFGEYEAIYALAREHNLRVIEDAAHAFGCRLDGQRCGSFGDIICFSFDGIKNITSGEGGAVVSADETVIQKVQDARLLGVEKDSEKRLANQRSWDFDVTAQGWRYHMSELMAAIGRVQLSRFEEFAERRVALAQTYQQALGSLPGLRCFDIEYGPIVPHIFVVLIQQELRDHVKAALDANGIGVGMHYQPNHRLSLYRQEGGGFSHADTLHQEMLTLPLHPMISDADQQRIIRTIKEAVNA